MNESATFTLPSKPGVPSSNLGGRASFPRDFGDPVLAATGRDGTYSGAKLRQRLTCDTDRLKELHAGSHRPQLDGVRGLAIVLVLVSHLFFFTDAYFSWWALGPAGVRLFFVLSGFLITDILLRARDQAEREGVSRFVVWRAFYVRRALRILPLGYLVILVAVALYPVVQPWWYVAYLGNFHVLTPHWPDGLNHFWSLAVEEQFYLVWPIVILALPRRHHRPLMLALILTAGLLRGAYAERGEWLAAYVLPWTRMDALVAGGLLALDGVSLQQSRRCGGLGLALIAIAFLWPANGAWAAVTEWGSIALCAAVVSGAAVGFRGRIGAALIAKPMVYLGVISYGLYAWHPFITEAAVIWGRHLAASFSGMDRAIILQAFLVLSVFVSVGWAALSWQWFEKPINALKRYAPYCPKTRVLDSRRDPTATSWRLFAAKS